MSARQWSGDEWQEWCVELIRRTYGGDQVQPVPSRHGGDLGIEAFTHRGHVFQCYVAQEPLTTKDRYENQRDKLSRDLTKLESKTTDFERILGSVRIRCYFFLVPHFDSRHLVQHATTKSKEYVKKGLSILADDFRIVVADDDAFPEAKAEALNRVRHLVDLPPLDIAVIEDWIRSNEGIISRVNQKLTPIFNSTDKRESAVNALMTEYLESDNMLQDLRLKYPRQWEDVVSSKSRKERRLVLEYGPSRPQVTNSLSIIVEDLVEEFRCAVPVLSEAASRTLAWGSVADWLARCPLDFADQEG